MGGVSRISGHKFTKHQLGFCLESRRSMKMPEKNNQNFWRNEHGRGTQKAIQKSWRSKLDFQLAIVISTLSVCLIYILGIINTFKYK